MPASHFEVVGHGMKDEAMVMAADE